MNFIFCLMFGYLIGSIPTAYIFGKILKGIDIREHGSGNVGGTNAIRVLGKVPGTTVLLIDVVKGIVPVTVIGNVFQIETVVPRLLIGVAAVCGHNWTIFLKFKGGKGIATSLGVLIGLAVTVASLRPVLTVCILGWLAAFFISGYVSLASLIAASLLPVAMVLTGQTFEMIALGFLFFIFVVFRHKSNIKRLLSGEEVKVKTPFQKSNK